MRKRTVSVHQGDGNLPDESMIVLAFGSEHMEMSVLGNLQATLRAENPVDLRANR